MPLSTLAAGPHWLAVEVWALGPEAPKWQVPIPPGLLVLAGEPFFTTLSTGYGAWESAALESVDFVQQAEAFLTGPRAVIDGGRHPWGWTTGWKEEWFVPARSANRGVCGGKEGGDGELPWLVAAQLPLPSHEALTPGTVVFVDAPDLPDSAGNLPPADPEANLAQELPAWQSWLDGKASLVIAPGNVRRALVFLGTYRTVWPVLRAAGAGGRIRLRFGEALYEQPLPDVGAASKGDRREWKNKGFRGLGPDFLTTSEEHEFRAYEWECGQWLEVTAIAGDAPVTLSAITIHDTSFPFHDEGALACDAPELESLRELCIRTLRVGTHGHYCDCPAYERLQYLGDTRLEILATYCLTNDNRLPVRALEDFAGARFADGLLPSRFPASGRQSIPPFSLWWIGMLHDAVYWRSYPRLPDLLPVARGILDAWWNTCSADGLAQNLPGWNFVDWAKGWSAGMPSGADGGISSILNWHFVWALRRSAELEEIAGEQELAELQRRRANTVTSALDAACWDGNRGLYLDAPGSTEASEHAQILALLAGVNGVRRERVAAALNTVPGLTRTTIYFTHYLFEALRLLGRGDRIWSRLGLWFDLPAIGLATTPEQPEPTRSDCHPWGAHPLYHIVATLAGLRPASPAFASAELAPLTDIPLCRLALTVPHPLGRIQVALERSSHQAPWAGSLTLPPGVSASASDGIEIR